jgi:hypothetical protein
LFLEEKTMPSTKPTALTIRLKPDEAALVAGPLRDALDGRALEPIIRDAVVGFARDLAEAAGTVTD